MDWTIIAIFVGIVIIAYMFYSKIENHGKNIKIIIIIVVLVVLYLSVVSVFKSDQLDLKSPRGIIHAGYVYFGWIGKTASNLWDVGTETTGRVIEAVELNETVMKGTKK